MLVKIKCFFLSPSFPVPCCGVWDTDTRQEGSLLAGRRGIAGTRTISKHELRSTFRSAGEGWFVGVTKLALPLIPSYGTSGPQLEPGTSRTLDSTGFHSSALPQKSGFLTPSLKKPLEESGHGWRSVASSLACGIEGSVEGIKIMTLLFIPLYGCSALGTLL